MGGGVSVDQGTSTANQLNSTIPPNADETTANIKAACLAGLGDRHWKDELKLYKLESIIITLEQLGCRTNDDVLSLPNHMWNEIQLKLKLLDQKRFNHLREKFVVCQHVSGSSEALTTSSSSSSKPISANTATFKFHNVSSPIYSNSFCSSNNANNNNSNTNNNNDNEDCGIDLPVYPENNASYDVIVKQMAFIKEDLQHITELMGCGKYVTVIPYCLRHGLIQSKQLLLERLERCKARRAVLEANRVASAKSNRSPTPRSNVTSPRKVMGSGRNSSYTRSSVNSSRCLSPAETMVSSSNTGTATPLKNRPLRRQNSNLSLTAECSITATSTSLSMPVNAKTVTFESNVKVTSGNGTSSVLNYCNRIKLTRQNSF